MKKANILTDNDQNILGCTFYHNNLAGKIEDNKRTLDTISDVDLLVLDDTKQAKRVAKLKKLMEEATKLSREISDAYNAAQLARQYALRAKYND